ncbi:glycosyltransferase family 4 protein [Thermus brockianus]|uniref:glycosyltransferase family 4 protein n=1 Tax=Thermus brockianus TaxID=56956 RepID=UPI001FCB7C29|nr:glycosyltransferase family 4 protein [Thermus brockianus]
MVVGTWGPLRSDSGGPYRVAYDLLRGLSSNDSSLQVYYSDFSRGFIQPLQKLGQDLGDDSLVKDRQGMVRSVRVLARGLIKYTIANPVILDCVPKIAATRVRYFLADLIQQVRFHLARPRIAGILREMPDQSILHIHGAAEMGDALVFLLENIEKSCKVVWTEHSKGSVLREWEHLFGSRFVGTWGRGVRRAYEVLLRRADRVVFPSKGAVQLFEEYTGWKIPLERLRIIYNGVEDPLLGLREPKRNLYEKGLFVTVAQHVPEKGLDWILEGLAMVKRPWRWVVVGGFTPWTASLRSLVRKYRLEAKVDFVGPLPRDEVFSLMARSEAVIHAPRVAVFDLALLEAMALAKPILATPVGGNVEALGEEYPLFVRASEQLAKYIDEGNGKFYELVGQNNRKRFLEKFNIPAMVQSHVSLYREIW